MRRAALEQLAADAEALAVRARALLAEDAEDPAELVPVAEASRLAKCSVRALSEARRAGVLEMFGGQRSRCVRRGALAAWIESRRVRPLEGRDDLDMRRRIVRLEQARAAKRTA